MACQKFIFALFTCQYALLYAFHPRVLSLFTNRYVRLSVASETNLFDLVPGLFIIYEFKKKKNVTRYVTIHIFDTFENLNQRFLD